jgi:YVTN family beta-propeller protein
MVMRNRTLPLGPAWACATLLLALGVPSPARAEFLIVLNKSDHDAALVDPGSLEIVAKLPTGTGPHEVAVSPDGRLAFVANYGAFGLFRPGEPPRNEPGNTLTVIDLTRRAVVDTFDLGSYTRPHGIVVSRDGRRLWVTCEGARSVLELEVPSGKIVHAWSTDQEISHMVVATPDERKLFVANIRSGSVTVIERASGQVRSIPTGEGAEGIEIAPDGREVWVANRGANTISVLDAASDSIVATLDSGGEFPIRARFTPDGREVWVSTAKSNRVSVFDAARRERVGAVDVGAMPVGIQMSPDGARAFVANTNDDQVTVIDVARREVVTTFSTGKEPDGMAWAPAPAPPRR